MAAINALGNSYYPETAGPDFHWNTKTLVANLASQLALAYMLAKTPGKMGKLRHSFKYTED